MTDDDSPTPQPHTPSSRDLPTHDLPSFLRSQPTTEERAVGELIGLVGLHSGAHVPWWMFVRLAMLAHKMWEWICARSKMERRLKRYAWAGLGALAANLLVGLGFAYHRIDEAGAAREHARNVDSEIVEIKLQLAELRALLWKRFGLAPGPQDLGSAVLGSILPRRLRSDAVDPQVACGAPCLNSIQCTDAFPNCYTCWQGTCQRILPADPVTDAGVDAPAAK